MSKGIFFTGFPGFIGRRLVKKIAATEKETNFIFLVQPQMQQVAESEISKLQKQFSMATFTLFAGDITHKSLGLSNDDYEKVAQQITDIFHLAAIYDLSVPSDLAWRVNVEGTKNIIALAYAAKNLEKFVYYSTCYVAGKRTGRVLEDELVKGQQFKNFYEETKYYAEVEIRKHIDKLPIITIRPSIVVGDSQTGETQKFDGPYFMMIFLDSFNVGLPLPLIGEAEAYFNIVPVDYIVNGSIALWQKKDNQGRTYALADPGPLKAKELYALFSERILGSKPSWAVPEWLIEGALHIEPLRKLLGIPVESLEYLRHEVEYDCRNAVTDLKETNVSCPRVADYAQNMIDFFLNHKDEEKYRVKVN